jgi:signal transduction histidine kinase
MAEIATFAELKASVVRTILVRRITLGVFSGISLVVLLVGGFSYLNPLFYAPLAWFALTFPFKLLIERQRTPGALHWAHAGFFVVEIALITALVHLMGGSEWVGSIFYLFTVIYANFFLPPLHGGLITGLVVAFYAGLVLLEYAGAIPHRSLFALLGEPYESLSYNLATILAGAAGVYAVVAFTVRTFTAIYARKNQLLAVRERQLAEMSRRLLYAQDEERRRVARELHDGLIQSLAAIKLRVATAREDASPEEAAEMTEMIDRAIGETRTLAYSLRPPLLDDLGLLPSLRRLGETIEQQSDLTVEIDADLPARLDIAVESLLFHIAQQAVQNVIDHARARRISLEIRRTDGHVRLAVVDDGVGFRAEDPQGLGLRGIRERVEVCGGRMSIETAPGQGARVTVEVPSGDDPSVGR